MLFENVLDRLEGDGATEGGEGSSFCDFPCRLEKSRPGRTSQSPSNADPADARIRQLGDVREVTTNQDIDRLGSDRTNHCGNLCMTLNTRRVEAIGPSFSVRSQSSDRFRKVGSSYYETFRPAGQKNARSALVD